MKKKPATPEAAAKAKASADRALKKFRAKQPKRELGRKPDAFSPEDIANLEKLIGAGNTTKASCEALGVPEKQFYVWLARAEQVEGQPPPKPLYVDFEKRMRMAKGLNKVNGVGIIAKHAVNDWRAQAWLLERQFPDEFAQRDKVDVNVKGAVQHDHSHKVIHVHIPGAIAHPRLPVKPTDGQ